MQFSYYYVPTAMHDIDVEDIGNFAFEVLNEVSQEYIIIVKTEHGMTKVIQYGPLIIDSDKPWCKMQYTYNEFQFNVTKISGIVDKFLNNTTMASQVNIISIDEAISKIKDLVNFL